MHGSWRMRSRFAVMAIEPEAATALYVASSALGICVSLAVESLASGARGGRCRGGWRGIATAKTCGSRTRTAACPTAAVTACVR